MATIGELAVNVVANTGGLDRGLNRSRQSVKSFASSMGGAGLAVRQFVAPVAAAAGALAGLGSVAGTVFKGITLAADAEQTKMAFEVMLGSADRAKTVLADLSKFAIDTPFGKAEVIGAARGLLNAGVATEDLTRRLTQLGNIAAGAKTPLGEVALVYQQVANKGKLQAEEMLQFAERGIPVYQALADAMGTTTGEIQKMASRGELNINHLNRAFERLAGAGGQYDGLMAKLSQSAAGLFSTFEDGIAETLTDFGDLVLEGFNLKGGLQELIAGANDFNKAFGESLPELREGFHTVRQAVSDLGASLTGETERAKQFQVVLEGIAGAITKIGQGVELLDMANLARKLIDPASILNTLRTEGLEGVQKQALELRDKFMQADVSVRAQAGAVTASTAGAKDAATGKTALGEMGLATRALAEEAKRAGLIQSEAARIFEATRTPVESFRAELEKLGVLYRGNAIDIATFHRAATDARRRFDEETRRRREADPMFKAAQERQKEMRDRAQEIFDGTRTPMETFRKDIGELFDLGRNGLLDPATLQRRRAEIFKTAREGLPSAEPTQFAGAALKGTQEAFSAIAKAGAQDQQIGELRKVQELLVRIERATIDGARGKPAVVASLGP